MVQVFLTGRAKEPFQWVKRESRKERKVFSLFPPSPWLPLAFFLEGGSQFLRRLEGLRLHPVMGKKYSQVGQNDLF